MVSPYATFMRPDSNDRGEMAADIAIRIIADDGCSAVTLRSLGDAIGVTPPGVRQWFGDTEGMWVRIVACCGRRWVGWISDWRRTAHVTRSQADANRALVLLPFDDEERSWTRVWLSLVERSRGRNDLAEVIAKVEGEELATVRRLVPGISEVQAEGLVAQARGLRHALCAGVDPMPIQRAQELLTAFTGRTGLLETPSATGAPPD
jgi:AcrR family transcriptional regulator